MKAIKKIIILGFICFHLSMIICINLNHFFRDYADLYPSSIDHLPIIALLESFTSSRLHTFYSTYTGTNSSYGFYAPNVGSEFTHSYAVIDSNLNIIAAHSGPEFLQKESNFRFNLCTMPIQDMLLDSLSISNEYIKVMEHQISEHFINKYSEAECVITRIYVCHYPTPEKYINGDRREVEEIMRYNFCNFDGEQHI